jgi:hypothetical protein
MAAIKIKQKLGKDSFSKLQSQLKDKGVKVIKYNADGFVTADDVIGRLTSVFNVNNEKLEVYLDLKEADRKKSFKVTRIQDDFYVMRDAH